ncbi:MAG: hypothetical protein ACYC1Z_13675 [Georgenia sp.]
MLLVVLLAAVPLAISILVAAHARPVRVADDAVTTLRAARRHEDLTALVSLLGVLVTPVPLMAGATTSLVRLGSPGLVSALSLTIGALVFLAVHYVGERTWPRPAGHLRQATLRRRTLRELAGHRGRGLLVTTAVAVVGLSIFGLTATESGRAVPTLITPEAVGEGFAGGASGPYPGWAYGLPILAAFAVVLGATWLVLRLVARRPAVAGTHDADDHALRRTSAARVLGGVQLFLGGTLTAVLLVAAQALHNSGWALGGAIAVSVAVLVGAGAVMAPVTAVRPVTREVAAARDPAAGPAEPAR